MTLTLIGSTAAKHWFPDFRDPKDTDYHGAEKPSEVPENTDVFVDERLGQWDWGAIATPEELYTMKVSHSYWEIGRGQVGMRNWQKHMSDVVFFQRKGVEFIPELHDILVPIWKSLHKRNPTNLKQGVAFDALERWKAHPAYPKYEVSNFGRLRGPYGISEGVVASSGRYRQFSINGKTVLAHAVVAETWIGPRPEGEEVRHLDGDGMNNRVLNLAYGTKEENAQDKKRHGTAVMHEEHPLSKLTLPLAREIRAKYAKGEHTHRSLADEYNVAPSLIGRIIRNESWPEKQGFFDDAVKRKYVHDSVHASIAYFDEPLFKSILADGEEVMVDSSKFFDGMDYETQLKLVREEVMATALERILIPNNYTSSPSAAYSWALQRTITSLFKNRWATWTVLHYDTLARPDCDYVSRHLENKDKLVLL